jgi:hypothetical protein
LSYRKATWGDGQSRREPGSVIAGKVESSAKSRQSSKKAWAGLRWEEKGEGRWKIWEKTGCRRQRERSGWWEVWPVRMLCRERCVG